MKNLLILLAFTCLIFFAGPVQPGNSGGPLFDDRGNLIGIINAKHLETENVTDAIKASYLLNLIDLMPTTPILQTQNILKNRDE